MHEIAVDLLLLLGGIWLVAVTLRPLGLPTVMGELIVGVLLGPAVFGWITPSESIQLLAEIGIFFLMFHAGVETQPREFYDALKRSIGVAVVGAIVPFCVSFGIATFFGLDFVAATFVGLTMTATAVVITLKSLKDLGLANTRLARVIVASCVIDDMLTLIVFGLVIGLLSGGTFEPMSVVITLGKVVFFFVQAAIIGRFIYPRLSLPFRSEGGKGFTFVLLTAIAAGLVAEAIGLHMILGAYLAGLFFEEKVAHPNLVRIVQDRAYGIAYSFLGPIFFITLGFSVTFDISASEFAFMGVLTGMVIVGQIVSAGGMALRMGMPAREALTVGVGMCGRAEMAFILASLALAQGAIGQPTFTVLIITAFVLNLFTPLALKGCAVMLEGSAVPQRNATSGVVLPDKFNTPLTEERTDGLLRALPDVTDCVVIYGYGPEVDTLLQEVASREQPAILIEENEATARKLVGHGFDVVHASLEAEELDLRPLAQARILVANGDDDLNALFALMARENGYAGTIIGLIDDPARRSAMQVAGATFAYTPTHILAAGLATRASDKIGPRIRGAQPLAELLEVVEMRIREGGEFAGKTLAESAIRTRTGATIVGQWSDDALRSPPSAEDVLQPGMILVAAGNTESIRRLSEIARPIAKEGPIVVVGHSAVGKRLVEMLTLSAEEVVVIDEEDRPGVTVVGDILDPRVLEQASVSKARVIILTLESDSAIMLAASVIRGHARDVPIIASAALVKNVSRIQEAGADYALSVSQVAWQLLAPHVAGETVSSRGRIKLVKRRAGGKLAGKNPFEAEIRERTGCSVVALERKGEIVMEISPSLRLEKSDALFVCGTARAIERFHDVFHVPHEWPA